MPGGDLSYIDGGTSLAVEDMTVGDLLRGKASETPGVTALIEGVPDGNRRRRWTYAELLRDSERTAQALLSLMSPGERVAVWAPNSPEWLLVQHGAALAGVTLVTVNPSLSEEEVRHVLEQSRADVVLAPVAHRGRDLWRTVMEVRSELPHLREIVSLGDWELFLAGGGQTELPRVSPDDIAQIQFTSGTTGRPKGVLLRHRGIVNVPRIVFETAEMTKDVVFLNPLPLFHTGGCCTCNLGPLAHGGAQVIVDGFDAARIVTLINEERATALGAVPTMLVALVEECARSKVGLPSLRTVVGGGAPLAPDLVTRIEQRLAVEFINLYGQTELSPVVSMTRPADSAVDKATTIGRPIPQIECKVVDPATGATLPVGASGELCARGYQQMAGYLDNPTATSETVDGSGWLHTGDLCAMDARGFITITGRLKDLIIRGGENIYPREIEDCLVTHPAVEEAAVIPIADDYWGEIVGAVLRCGGHDAPSRAELTAHCSASLARYKTPQRWFIVESFPLTGSGKIQKQQLREQAESGTLLELGPSAGDQEPAR